MTQEEIREVLTKHKRWLEESEGWSEDDRADLRGADLRRADLRRADLSRADLSRADLSRANLYGANLSRANLYGADLYGADLYGADLYGADLRGADLYGADLRRADLRRADLRGADLRGADLRRADLRRADLSRANLSRANLYGANLYGANLSRANLRGADLYGADLYGAENVPFIPYACPDFGIFIGFKKAHDHIVVLEIPEDARRLSATRRKCRCDKAKVLQIQNLDGSESELTEVVSDFSNNFIYKVGEVVSVPDFDEDRWNECSTGIHFFINRQEAVEY